MTTRYISEIAFDNLTQALALNYSDLESARARLRSCSGGMAERLKIKREISDLITARQRLVRESV